MNRVDFERLLDSTFQSVRGINRTKGREYADDDDALRNFKKNGPLLGLTPTQHWGVLFLKHVDALVAFARDGEVKSEPIESRVHDVILYAGLLLGLVEDRRAAEAQLALPLLSEVHDRENHLPIEHEAANVVEETQQSMQGLRTAARVNWPEPRTTSSNAGPVEVSGYHPTVIQRTGTDG